MELLILLGFDDQGNISKFLCKEVDKGLEQNIRDDPHFERTITCPVNFDQYCKMKQTTIKDLN